MGRPSKLTRERHERIVNLIRGGVYVEIAARAAGIDGATYYRWMEKGAEPGAARSYREFREACTRARAEAESRHVLLIDHAARTDWRAAAWFLERSFPARYGQTHAIEHTGAEGGPITLAGLEALMGIGEKGSDGDD